MVKIILIILGSIALLSILATVMFAFICKYGHLGELDE